ncbi:MAG: hypothetical protein E8A49_19950 [Phenylobacterium sp.]|nr:MAG: hypothetical protein E8A49_19950 [Phenylobacterium sp.]
MWRWPARDGRSHQSRRPRPRPPRPRRPSGCRPPMRSPSRTPATAAIWRPPSVCWPTSASPRPARSRTRTCSTSGPRSCRP